MTTRINLTDTRIKALQPPAPGKRRDVPDPVVPGLIIRISSTGHKTFMLRSRVPGSSKPLHSNRRAIGEVGTITIDAARATARAWIELIGKGIDPAEEIERVAAEAKRRREAEQASVGSLFKNVAEDYLKRKVAGQRRAAWAQRLVRNELIAAWGDKNISAISRRDVVRLVEEINDRGAPMQAHAVFGAARTLFGWAINRGSYDLEHSPTDHVKISGLLSKQKKPRQRTLTNDEILAFWKASGRLGYPWRQMFRLLLLTGTRRTEAAGARWNEFNLDKALWVVPAVRFKSDAEHLVPLSGEALSVIAELPKFKHGDHLFSFTFGAKPALILHSAKVRLDALMLRYLRALARSRGDNAARVTLTPFVIHDLRRTVRTKLSALKVNDTVAEMCLGHGRRGLQRVYDQHQYIDEMKEAFEKWASELRRIVEPAAPNSNVVLLHKAGG